MRILKCLILLFVIIAVSSSLSGATIIFDLNGVLVTQSGAWWEIGPWNFFGLYNFSTIQRDYFTFLDSVESRNPNIPQAMHDNRPLPQIMHDWLSGNCSNAQILAKINNKLLERIIPKRNRKLFKAIATYMFTPARFAKTIVPIKSGKKLFQKCRNAKNPDGSFKHKIYILSNWDAESFPYLLHTKEIREIITQADGVIISGSIHMLKPDPLMYQTAFEKFGIDPDNELTLYIDDEKINIESAQSLGKKKLLCLQCKNNHFSLIKKTFKQLLII